MDEKTFMALGAQCERIENSRHIDEYVDLSRIKAETLIINGEDDAILDNQDLLAAASRIPHCEVKIVKGVGHFLHWERDDMLDLYERYLKNVPQKIPK